MTSFGALLATAADSFPAWSPDGKRIAFSSERDGNDEIYVMDTDGSNLIRLTNRPELDWWPAWSPDGMRIAYATQKGKPGDWHHEIWIMNADGSNQICLTLGPSDEAYPAWSP